MALTASYNFSIGSSFVILGLFPLVEACAIVVRRAVINHTRLVCLEKIDTSRCLPRRIQEAGDQSFVSLEEYAGIAASMACLQEEQERCWLNTAWHYGFKILSRNIDNCLHHNQCQGFVDKDLLSAIVRLVIRLTSFVSGHFYIRMQLFVPIRNFC